MATLEIFNVAHGQCSLISSDDGAHMLIDCGHNGGTGWRPSDMLARRGMHWLDELVITNCDEDHASDLPNVLATVDIGCLTRNPTVAGDIRSNLAIVPLGVGGQVSLFTLTPTHLVVDVA